MIIQGWLGGLLETLFPSAGLAELIWSKREADAPAAAVVPDPLGTLAKTFLSPRAILVKSYIIILLTINILMQIKRVCLLCCCEKDSKQAGPVEQDCTQECLL